MELRLSGIRVRLDGPSHLGLFVGLVTIAESECAGRHDRGEEERHHSQC